MPSINEFEAPYPSLTVANSHPFSPIIIVVPGFVATSIPTATLLITFFGGLAVILASSKYFLEQRQPSLSKGEVWTASWFILCGFIHTLFEGEHVFEQVD